MIKYSGSSTAFPYFKRRKTGRGLGTRLILINIFTFCALFCIYIIQVNTNGILSFRSQFLSWTPQQFPFFGSPLIAPFWDDVNINRFGNIFYRQSFDDTLLQRARDQIRESFSSSGNFTPTVLLIATWDRVAEFAGGPQVSA